MENFNYRVKEKSFVARLAALKLGVQSVAIVVGKTIHLHNCSKENFLQDSRWVKHELCHIKQFREHGFFTFITKYIAESIRHGYYNNRFEIEARAAESDPA